MLHEGMTQVWDLLLSGDIWTWTWQVILIPVTLIIYDVLEWFTHKYVSHGLGRNPKSFYNFHWGDHHRNVRRNGFYDDEFKGSLFSWNAQGKEALLLTLTALLYLPLLFIAPFCYLALIYGSLRYRWVHRRAHTDPAWAKVHVPWHYDHHMGVN